MRWENWIEPTAAHDTIRTSALCLWAMTTVYFCAVVPSSVDILNSVVQTDFIFIISNDFSFVFFRAQPQRGRQKDLVFNFKFQHNFNVYTLHLNFRPFGDIYLRTRSVLFFCPVMVIRWKEGKYLLITCNAADLKHRAALDCSGSRRRVKFHCRTKISFIRWNYMVPWPLPSFHCWRRPTKILEMEKKKRARDRRCQRRIKKNHTMELNYIIYFFRSAFRCASSFSGNKVLWRQ